MLVELRSGFAFGFPPECIPGLEGAPAEQLAAVQVSPSGDGLSWDDLDVHVNGLKGGRPRQTIKPAKRSKKPV